MGFLLKYVSVSFIVLIFIQSTFFSIHTTYDVLGEINHQNFSTILRLEELVVSDNDSLIFKAKDMIFNINGTLRPLPG